MDGLVYRSCREWTRACLTCAGKSDEVAHDRISIRSRCVAGVQDTESTTEKINNKNKTSVKLLEQNWCFYSCTELQNFLFTTAIAWMKKRSSCCTCRWSLKAASSLRIQWLWSPPIGRSQLSSTLSYFCDPASCEDNQIRSVDDAFELFFLNARKLYLSLAAFTSCIKTIKK